MNKFKVTNYKIIENLKGNIYKFASNDKFPYFIKGDIYFSEIAPKEIKAWRKHKALTSVFGVVKGEIKMKIKSKFDNNISSELLSLNKSKLITIPPTIWYGFENLSSETALIFVMLNGNHNKNEIESSDFKKEDWGK